MQHETTRLVVYLDYTSKCTKNATKRIKLVSYQYTASARQWVEHMFDQLFDV